LRKRSVQPSVDGYIRRFVKTLHPPEPLGEKVWRSVSIEGLAGFDRNGAVEFALVFLTASPTSHLW
jgi:hypothetical protein